jgi:hypothetical protein
MSAESRLSTLTNNRIPMRRESLRCLAAVLLVTFACAFAAGCSSNTHTPVYPVQGQILLNGKPLSEAIVTFHPQGNAPAEPLPSAHTDAEGRFKLTSFATGDGAPEGNYAISLVCFRTHPIRKGFEGDATNIVPARYANASTSRLTATVVRGPNELPPLQVKTP